MPINLKSELHKSYFKSNIREDQAFEGSTHLAIVAHQDDAEFMSFHGIKECYNKEDKNFSVIVCTDGSGSISLPNDSKNSNSNLKSIRNNEQIQAAKLGNYNFAYMLNYESSDIKFTYSKDLLSDLKLLIQKCKPEVIYTHNPADKHLTHVGVFMHVIKILKEICIQDKNYLPKKIFGCELWRSLDWLSDKDKILLEHSGDRNLEENLNQIYKSQISSGKNYNKAILGRRLANATFLDPNSKDISDSVTYGIDLTKLVQDKNYSVKNFINDHLKNFINNVNKNIDSFE